MDIEEITFLNVIYAPGFCAEFLVLEVITGHYSGALLSVSWSRDGGLCCDLLFWNIVKNLFRDWRDSGG